MSNFYLFEMFRSRYCQVAFLVSTIISLLIIPKSVFSTLLGAALGVLFIIIFSLNVTCFVRNVKEKILLSRTYKSSFLGGLGAVIGLGAAQMCGINAGICTASVGVGLSFLLPSMVMAFISEYSLIILSVSIVLQLVALYFMNCFKSVKE